MLCLAGCVPVENDDQATGEIRREGRLEPVVAALLGQLLEVGQLAARRTVTKMTRNDEAMANPAPGPM